MEDELDRNGTRNGTANPEPPKVVDDPPAHTPAPDLYADRDRILGKLAGTRLSSFQE
jgi:hypothetical protein